MSDKRKMYKEKKGPMGSASNLKRPRISKRRPLNCYELEMPDVEKAGTSARKLSKMDLEEFEVEEGFGYRILNFLAVFSAISQAVVCKKCKSEVTFTESAKRGLGFKIVISCQKCVTKFIFLVLHLLKKDTILIVELCLLCGYSE